MSISVGAFAQSERVLVEAVDVDVTAQRTRVTLATSGDAAYRFFRLGNPQRAVIDLENARLAAPSLVVEGPRGPVLGVRHGRRSGEVLRIVLDLEDGEYQTRDFTVGRDTSGAGYRIVIDLIGDYRFMDSQAPGSQASDSSIDAGRDPATVDEAGTAASAVLPGAAGTSVAAASAVASPEDSVSAPGRGPASPEASSAVYSRRSSGGAEAGTSVSLSGTWQHELAWATEPGEAQKFESFLQPRWDVSFANGVDLTAVLRLRADTVGDLGPADRTPANYSGLSAPWYNSAEGEVSLRELFLDFQWGAASWRLGKQQVVWGQADGIKVLDVVNPQSFREFILDDFDDSRIPLWTVNMTMPLGDAANLQLLWIPDTTYHELADPATPFAFSSPRLLPQVPITAIAEADKPDSVFSDSDIGAALSGFVGGWDLSLNYLYRYLDAPVLAVRQRGPLQFQLEPEYRRSHLLGGTFSNAFGSLGLRGEFAYNSDTFQPSNSLANDAVAQSSELSSVIGVDWTVNMDTLISAQFLLSHLFDHRDTMARDASEQTLTLLYQQDFANATWRVRGVGLRSLNDDDMQFQFKLSHWYSGSLELWLGYDAFSGDSNGLFGQFDENDRVLLGFELGF